MKPGPKTEPFLEGVRARTVSLDDLTMEMARVLSLGEDNASKGIRNAVRFAFDLYQADRFTPGRTTSAPVVPQLRVPAEPLPAAAAGTRPPPPARPA